MTSDPTVVSTSMCNSSGQYQFTAIDSPDAFLGRVGSPRREITHDGVPQSCKIEVGANASTFVDTAIGIQWSKTPCPVASSASFLHDIKRMAQMAHAIGKADDAKYYAMLLAELKPLWHKVFWNPVANV